MERKEFNEFIHAIGSEIEQAQIKLVSAANSQMLLHYWKMGNFILYYQKQLGWGSKTIQQISQALRSIFPDKKGYSPRNLQYMCQFVRLYPLESFEKLILADKELKHPAVNKVMKVTKELNEYEFAQPLVAQIQHLFLSSCLSRINWAGHVILMNHKLPLGTRYWYMQETIQYGWSRNILDLQIKNELFQRQIKENKVNNFSKILPDVQSDLANYLLKDPYIFDLSRSQRTC